MLFQLEDLLPELGLQIKGVRVDLEPDSEPICIESIEIVTPRLTDF